MPFTIDFNDSMAKLRVHVPQDADVTLTQHISVEQFFTAALGGEAVVFFKPNQLQALVDQAARLGVAATPTAVAA